MDIFYPISKGHFFVFKEVFSENSVLMYGLYSRAAYDGARMALHKKFFTVYADINADCITPRFLFGASTNTRQYRIKVSPQFNR